MSTSQNKEAVRRLNEATNKGDLKMLDGLFDASFVSHTSPEMKGPEAMKQSQAALRSAFPDYHEKIEHMVAEEDMVAAFYTLTGTFKGKYQDIAPTGKRFSVPLAVLSRFVNGKQVESWLYMNSLDWYRQLGIPVPEAQMVGAR